MKLRKFDDFKRIYENNPGLMTQPGEPGELEMSGTEVKPQTPTKPATPTKPLPSQDPGKIRQPSVDPQRKAYMEEEEVGTNPDIMLQELSQMLDAPLVDGKIDYNGQVIEFYSETMCFAINGKSMKQLTTAEKTADYLMSTDTTTQQPGPAPQKIAQGPNQRIGITSQTQAQKMTSEKKHFHVHKKRQK